MDRKTCYMSGARTLSPPAGAVNIWEFQQIQKSKIIKNIVKENSLLWLKRKL